MLGCRCTTRVLVRGGKVCERVVHDGSNVGTFRRLEMLVLLLTTTSSSLPSSNPSSGQLKQHLFQSYDAEDAPPRQQDGRATAVTVGLNIVQVENVDILRGILKLHAWVRMSWHDARLSWAETTGYGEIELLRLPAARPLPTSPHAVWVPEVELLNGAQPMSSDTHSYDATLYKNGTVFWSRLSDLHVLCAFDGLRSFPKDDLTCTLKFGSEGLDDRYERLRWGSPEDALITAPVSTEGMGVGEFLEYEVKTDYVRPGEVMQSYSFAPGANFTVLTLEVPIRRHMKFYSWKLVSLTALLTFLSFGVFLAHPKAINRQHFSATLLLALITVDITVDSLIPRVSALIWMELFMFCSVFMCLLVSCENFLVLYLWWRADPTVLQLGKGFFGDCLHRIFVRITRRAGKVKCFEDDARAQLLSREGAPSSNGRGWLRWLAPTGSPSAAVSPLSFPQQKSADDRMTENSDSTAASFSFAPRRRSSASKVKPMGGVLQAMQVEDADKCSQSGSEGGGASGHASQDSFVIDSRGSRRRSSAFTLFRRSSLSNKDSDTDGSAADTDAESTVEKATFHIVLHASSLAGLEDAPAMGTTLEKRWLKRSLKEAIVAPALKEFRRQHKELHIQGMEICVSVDGSSADWAAPAMTFARSEPDMVTTVEVRVQPLRKPPDSVPFKVFISGARTSYLGTTLNKRMLGKPLKTGLVMPALDEYFRQHPDQPPVELGYVCVKVNSTEVNLEILEPASTFVTREAGSGDAAAAAEQSAIHVQIILPLINKEVLEGLEAAAAAAAAAATAAPLEAESQALQLVGPRAAQDVGVASTAASQREDADEETLNWPDPTEPGTILYSAHASPAAAPTAVPTRRERRSSLISSNEDMPSFASITNGRQQLLALRDSTKALARMVTATKMDPIDASLVRNVYRMLDDEKRGFLDEKQIELWVHHFGGLPGSVLDACGVQQYSKWGVDDFKSICQQVIREKGADRFGLMARGLEESILGRQAENEMYWHEMALRVDRASLWLFNGSYTLIIVALYVLREWGVFD